MKEKVIPGEAKAIVDPSGETIGCEFAGTLMSEIILLFSPDGLTAKIWYRAALPTNDSL